MPRDKICVNAPLDKYKEKMTKKEKAVNDLICGSNYNCLKAFLVSTPQTMKWVPLDLTSSFQVYKKTNKPWTRISLTFDGKEEVFVAGCEQ